VSLFCDIQQFVAKKVMLQVRCEAQSCSLFSLNPAAGSNSGTVGRTVVILLIHSRWRCGVGGLCNERKSCNVPAGELRLMHVALEQLYDSSTRAFGYFAGDNLVVFSRLSRYD